MTVHAEVMSTPAFDLVVFKLLLRATGYTIFHKIHPALKASSFSPIDDPSGPFMYYIYIFQLLCTEWIQDEGK